MKKDGKCPFLHPEDDHKKYLDLYHKQCDKYFENYYENVLKKDIHHMFRQRMCICHGLNAKSNRYWNLYKDCTFAHSEEER